MILFVRVVFWLVLFIVDILFQMEIVSIYVQMILYLESGLSIYFNCYMLLQDIEKMIFDISLDRGGIIVFEEFL